MDLSIVVALRMVMNLVIINVFVYVALHATRVRWILVSEAGYRFALVVVLALEVHHTGVSEWRNGLLTFMSVVTMLTSIWTLQNYAFDKWRKF